MSGAGEEDRGDARRAAVAAPATTSLVAGPRRSTVSSEQRLEVERMTAAELKVVREYLGLTTRWLAEHLHVAERSIHRWEMGASPIPEGVRLAVEQLEADTANVITAAVNACNDAVDPAILTYRTDEEYRTHHPEQAWPASWHRGVVARVAQEVPGLAIDYWGPTGAAER